MRDDPFFKDTPRTTTDMNGESIEFPILYYDLRMLGCTFSAKTSKLKKLLPHPNFQPLELWPGTGLLIISAFEYLDTSIGPYNEIAISIPVKYPPEFAIPGISIFNMMRKNHFSVYIHHLPVTTEIARTAGIYFYNYPKFLAEITYQDQDQNLVVTLKENDDLILKLNAQKLPVNSTVELEIHTYSIKENVVMHALVDGKAPRYGMKMMGGKAELELGDHPIGRELAALNLSKNVRGSQYTEGMMTKLYAPDKRWNVDRSEMISG